MSVIIKYLLNFLIFLMICETNSAGKSASIGSLFEEAERNWTWPMVNNLIKTTMNTIVGRSLRNMSKFPRMSNLSNSCGEALFNFVYALRRSEKWAVEMIDATAKLPSGILDGTVMDFGSYDECLSIRVNTTRNREIFRGQYCMIGYASPLITPLNEKTAPWYLRTYGEPPEWILEPMKKARGYLKKISFWFGTCVPSSCTTADIENVARSVAEPLGLFVNVADCQVEELHRKWNDHEITAVAILCSLACLTLLGTIVDMISRIIRGSMEQRQTYFHENTLLRFCKSLSLYANTEKLLHTTSGILSFFHGIRFLSATWIILGHTYFFVDTWKFLKYRHLIGFPQLFDNHILTGVIDNFTIPVGSFFFMSGFLMTYINWPKLERSAGRLNVAKFLFHKYWRMAPALCLTIVLLMAMPLIDSGPLWNTTLNPQIEVCKENWWKNILFINNWWDVDDFCLIHTWYLAALMQFHIIAIILLLIIYRWSVFGVILALLLLIGCCAVTALHVVWFDFPMPAPGRIRDADVMQKYNSLVYIKPYAHFATYLTGMITGHAVLKYRQAKLTMGHHIVGWLMAITCGITSVYGIYGPVDTLEVRAVYISLHRLGWGFALAWVTFACACGKGGPVNRILSWKALQPLGQLSYLAYLLHPLVIMYRNASLKERTYFGHTELVFSFLSTIVVSYFLAHICYIALELPCSSLESTILSRTRKASLNNGYSNKDSANVAAINVTRRKEPA